MPELTIKDLPDTSKIDDKKSYVIKGVHWRAIVSLVKDLWRGENIGRGTVSPVQNGDSGYSLNGVIATQQVQQNIRRAHPLLPYDVSGGGATGLISVTAGSVTDLTNSGTVWSGATGSNEITINDPVYGVVPFAVPVGSGPSRQPQLALSPSATCSYLNATVNATTGFITAMEIDADSGGGMPSSTSTHFYTLLSDLTVTIISGVATVKILDDGAQSNLFFAICGGVPLTGGTQYRVGT